MTKKIGIVLASTPAYSETFFRNKIKGLQQNGIEVLLFVNRIDPLWDKTCPAVLLPSYRNPYKIVIQIINFIFVFIKKPLLVWKYFDKNRNNNVNLKKNIQKILLHFPFFNYDLDWIHFGFGTLAIGKEMIAETIDAKMAVSFRGFDLFIYPVKYPDCYDTLFKQDVQYHVLSDEMKNTLLENGISNEKIGVITPAIDISLFKKNNTVRDKKEIVFLTVARLHWKKGLEYTLEALSKLKNININFKYYIIGEGNEFERLSFAIHQLNLQNNVFLLGKKTQVEIIEYMEKSDIYLQYSLQEGFSNATLEAQAMGLICVVSDADGLSENVLDNITGYVVKKRNPHDLAAKIIHILSLQDEELAQIKNNAVTRVLNEFNIEKQIIEFLNFYQFKN